MPLFEVTQAGIQEVERASFADEGVRERQDLQRWLRHNPAALSAVLGEKLLIISEQFGNWEDSRRRIDLLGLDEEANLVVFELKRTDDGGHMDLQAIRYAAMISAMRFEDIVDTFEKHLERNEPTARDQAESRLRRFLDVPDGEVQITDVPRIVLISADFSLEITTAVLWLIDRGIDIRCVQVVPYKSGEKLLIDLRQLIPLPEAEKYQVRLRKKQEINRRVSGRREQTLHLLARNGTLQNGTEIEVVPAAMPADIAGRDPKTYRARIVDPYGRESVEWLDDGQAYSISKLTLMLNEDHDMQWLANSIAKHWRIVGHTESLWQEAERVARAVSVAPNAD